MYQIIVVRWIEQTEVFVRNRLKGNKSITGTVRSPAAGIVRVPTIRQLAQRVRGSFGDRKMEGG